MQQKYDLWNAYICDTEKTCFLRNAYEIYVKKNAHFNKKRPGMIRFLVNAAGGFNVVNTRVLSFNLKKPR